MWESLLWTVRLKRETELDWWCVVVNGEGFTLVTEEGTTESGFYTHCAVRAEDHLEAIDRAFEIARARLQEGSKLEGIERLTMTATEYRRIHQRHAKRLSSAGFVFYDADSEPSTSDDESLIREFEV